MQRHFTNTARVFHASLALLALLALSFSAGISQAEDKSPTKITIFAAASLKNALDAVCAEFRNATGTTTAVSYAASSALAKQIEHGAPADVFVSADLDWMDYLTAKNLIVDATRATIAGNSLVLIAPATSTQTLNITPGFDLAGALGEGRLSVGDVKAVPAGRYAKAALEYLGVWAAVEPKLVQSENVRAALVLVARGEAPLGVVYATDARADASVKVLGTFPDTSHAPILYPAAVVSASASSQTAAQFVQFLKSPTAQALFTKEGFAAAK